MPTITPEQRDIIHEYTEWFKQRFVHDVLSAISQQIPSFRKTGQIENMIAGLDLILHEAETIPRDVPITLDNALLPHLKRVLLSARRSRATGIECDKRKTHNADILRALESQLAPFDNLLNAVWLKNVTPITVPRLCDYLSLQQIESLTWNQIQMPEREYDEKFHILQAPKLFFDDLHYYRFRCELRGAPVVVAYLDIDDFKQRFNQLHGEVEIDRRVLPVFMRLLEGHMFGHGFAYRYGGDEYVLLIPNMRRDLAIGFLDQLRRDVAEIEYQGVGSRTTVSIGVCYLEPDCFLTDREAEERANRAKNYAKLHGKNCIATYCGSRFTDDELQVVSPLNKEDIREQPVKAIASVIAQGNVKALSD